MKSIKDMIDQTTQPVCESIIGRKNARDYTNVLFERHFEDLKKACQKNRIEFYVGDFIGNLRESGRPFDMINKAVYTLWKQDKNFSDILENCRDTYDVAMSVNNALEYNRY
jgi:hypothetical protein